MELTYGAHKVLMDQVGAPGVSSSPPPALHKAYSAAWTLIGRGVIYPHLVGDQGHPMRLHVTEKGVQVLAARQDAPHRAGFLKRLWERLPRIEDEVFTRLQDAQDCLDADLFRPAIVMIGIAAEVTIKAAYKTMAQLSLVRGEASQLKDMLVEVHAQHGALRDGDASRSDRVHRIKMALAFVETVRTQRNDAAHPGNPSPDGAIVRAQFTSACLHLPVVWELLVIPNLPPS